MESETTSRGRVLQTAILKAMQQLDLEGLEDKVEKLKAASQQPHFWQDAQAAQVSMKQIADLENRIKPWRDLQGEVVELLELLALGDRTMLSELSSQITSLEQRFEQLKGALLLSGPYDDHDAILTIHAGAGGTDAQDWAQILLRMYIRWAEKRHFRVYTDDESLGDEAGLKSVTIEVGGTSVYGQLKGEHGVHRLVRLSPFNADNLRQTSFAKVEVMPKIDTPDEISLDDRDLRIDVYRSGGHGGQSVNTTDSAVRITHIPTGITVAIQNERSQLQNKETALTILRSRLAQMQVEQHASRVSELKGPNEQAAWGNQIRSYVLHPYKQVKDLRTRYETSDVDKVLNGELEGFTRAYLEKAIGKTIEPS